MGCRLHTAGTWIRVGRDILARIVLIRVTAKRGKTPLFRDSRLYNGT